METVLELPKKIRPQCALFGVCGGCAYQDVPYKDELKAKEARVRRLLWEGLCLDGDVCEPIVPSPRPYHYRNRLDLSLLKIKSGECFMGFRPEGRFRVLEIDRCPISAGHISSFLPDLKKQASAKLPADYRVASLVVKTGDDGRVLWGGIGRRSLRLLPKDYLWTGVAGMKIFYSLDTFFQANSSILSILKDTVGQWVAWDKRRTVLLDLYAGVGLFGILFSKRCKRVVMVEDNPASVKVAHYNKAYHRMENIEIFEGRVEEILPECAVLNGEGDAVALIDPPRKGLSLRALEAIDGHRRVRQLLYLSCNPEALCRDLGLLIRRGWKAKRIVPFDFFPKTRHIETLALLER